MNIIRNSAAIEEKKLTLITFVDDVANNLVYKDILTRNGFEGKYKQILYLAEANIVFVGTKFVPVTKNVDPYNVSDYYELGALVIASTEKFGIKALRIKGVDQSSSELQLFLLGIMQRAWKFDKYLTKNKSTYADVVVHLSKELSALMSEDEEKLLMDINHGILMTRELVDETPEMVNPTSMKKIIKDAFDSFRTVSVSFLDKKELEKRSMQGITYVGRASRHEPFLSHVILKAKGETKKKICLVGKGVTYDSGGYDIKTEGRMKTMKCDMAGAATMFGVLNALALQGGLENTEVHWITGFVENMIDGSGYKADDIITTSSGITVEVLNTDAEGRLTLSDALTYATLQDPTYIVDAATLTGAAVVAVSEYYTALMSNDGELANSLLDTFEEEKEKTVYTPLPEILRDTLKGRISDLTNIASIMRIAGHKTAGLFLSYFVDQNLFHNKVSLGIKEPKAYPWVHLDIAGSAYNKNSNSLGIEGATGHSVRSLVKWLIKVDKE